MIKVGDRLPDGTFRVKQDDDSVSLVTVDELFKGQRVVFVGLPGAFTSTCHNAHVPQFVTNAKEIKAKGIDRIVVMATNDHHVMKIWGESLGGKGRIDFVADGTGEYTRALGLETDMSPTGLGLRCKRFSAVVEDGVVKSLNFEPEGGKGIQATGAATILSQI
jgi:glutaredoxin/glutathione-dependent peroxiredoxin